MKKLTWRMLRVLILFIGLSWSQTSHAYPWMIQHQYTGCAACHVDPSGGYLLTAYGRAQTQTLLSSFGKGPEGNEVTSLSNFAGVIPPNDYVNLGASLREAYMWGKAISPSLVRAAGKGQWLLMQADFRAAVTYDRVIATASLGYLDQGRHAAQVTTGTNGVAVSREHWVGVQLGEERNTTVRVGRMYVPFGIRTIEHPFYVRTNTRSNIDSQQQFGAAIYHEEEKYRFEVMLIAGNWQIAPDDYRERGYAGYVEFGVAPATQLGFSSRVTRAGIDGATFTRGAFFGAHGPMVRWSPADHVAVLAEADALHFSADNVPLKLGVAAMAQVDWEFTRGLHAMATSELYRATQLGSESGFSAREWLSVAWFLVPHVDVRLDSYWATDYVPPPQPVARIGTIAGMGMLHVSL